MKRFKIIANDVSWQLSAKLLRFVASFWVGAVVARHLGPAQFGTLNTAWASFAIVTPFVMGLDTLVIRDLNRMPENVGKSLGNLLLYKSIFGILLFITILTISFIFGNKNEGNIQFIVLGIVGLHMLTQPLDTFSAWFYSQNEGKKPVICMILALVLFSGIRLLGVGLNWGVILFAWLIVGELFLARLFNSFAFFRSPQIKKKLSLDLSNLWLFFKKSWMTIAAGIAGSVYLYVDLLMVKSFLGEHEAGIYSCATRLSMIFMFVPPILGRAVIPSLIRYDQSQGEDNGSSLIAYTGISAYFGYGCVIGGLILAPFLIPLLYGDQYSQSVGIFQIHCWVSIPLFLASARKFWFEVKGWLSFLFVFEVVGAVLNIVLNIILIPKFGVKGAAFSTLISAITSALLVTWMSKRTRSYAILQLQSLFLFNTRSLVRQFTSMFLKS